MPPPLAVVGLPIGGLQWRIWGYFYKPARPAAGIGVVLGECVCGFTRGGWCVVAGMHDVVQRKKKSEAMKADNNSDVLVTT